MVFVGEGLGVDDGLGVGEGQGDGDGVDVEVNAAVEGCVVGDGVTSMDRGCWRGDTISQPTVKTNTVSKILMCFFTQILQYQS